MSASDKKKLRNEQQAAKLTERQLTEQKEAKKLKTYTTLFVVILTAIVVIAIWAGATNFIENSGLREKNTVAVTIGDHEISNAEFNYYYIDAVNNFYNTYGDYSAVLGLDLTKPLNEQVFNEETGETWADDFLISAKDSAATTYAMADEAAAHGHTLSEDELATVDTHMQEVSLYAVLGGFSDADTYLKAVYGNGASEESYRAYYERNLLASSYYNAYSASLTYDEAALREAESENPNQYDTYSYNSYYLNASSFREGGTEDADGHVTYSDEEIAAGVAAAEEAAKSLTADNISTVDQLNVAISALEINADSATPVVSNTYEDYAYTSITSVIRDWVTSSERKAGDKTYIPNTSTTTAEDGTKTTTTNGYYVVMFVGSSDNAFALKNVRHILAAFEGGTVDEATQVITYSDDEKAAAKAEADEILASWQAGEATEDSFGALAIEKSDDTGSAALGGLIEDIYPGQMVEAFEDWVFADGRKAGDTGVVETEYGYHVMYFSGESDLSYRDFLITSQLRTADVNEWYANLVDNVTVTDGDTQYLSFDLIISPN